MTLQKNNTEKSTLYTVPCRTRQSHFLLRYLFLLPLEKISITHQTESLSKEKETKKKKVNIMKKESTESVIKRIIKYTQYKRCKKQFKKNTLQSRTCEKD